MADIGLTVIKTEDVVQDRVSLKSDPKPKAKTYTAEKFEISDNIKKFDRKVHTKNPYDYNTISLKRTGAYGASPTSGDLVSSPLYNSVGKLLGLDNKREWDQYYQKVYEITNWAKEKLGTDDVNKIVRLISTEGRRVPSMGSRRIDDIYIYLKLKGKK